MQPLKFSVSPKILWPAALGTVLLFALAYWFFLPVAEVARVERGTAISAVYGTVRIEPTFVIKVRAQNSGFIEFADELAAGRGAMGRTVAKGDLLATIADETTARQLKQAQADYQAAKQRAELPLPSSEPLKVAEDAVARLERLTSLSNIPQVEVEKAKSDVARLQGQLETERIERDRNLESLDSARKKLEAQMSNSEIRSPMDGLLTGIKAINGELVSEGSELFTVSAQKNYVRGEVNEEDVGAVKAGMRAVLQVYAFRGRRFTATVTAITPAADPETQRYTIMLDLEDPPDNLLAGMTGEMNIITGEHENALLVPTRALLVDQVLLVKNGVVHGRTLKTGYSTLDFTEVLGGLKEGDRVIVSELGSFPRRPADPAAFGGARRQRPETVTPPLYIALRFLAHRKRAFVLSMSGVVFGVAIFIATQAQTQGFANHFINSTLGSNGSLTLRARFQPLGAGLPVPPKKTAFHREAVARRYIEGIPNAREIMRVSRQFSNVAAASPILRGTLSARSGFENATVDLYGIDAPLHLQTTDLKKQLIAGDFEDFRDSATSVILGSKLAQEMNLAAGRLGAASFPRRRILAFHRGRDRA